MNQPIVNSTTPMGLRFELFVNDVALSVAFYRSTLGFEPPEDWSPNGYVPLRAGAVTIGVQQRSNLAPTHHFSPANLSGPLGVGLEVVIEVADVDLTYANAAPEARQHGGSVEPLADQYWGRRDFRLIDPDGYYVRVTSIFRSDTTS